MGEHAAYHAGLTKEGTEMVATMGVGYQTVYPFRFAFGTAAPPRTK